MRSAGTTDAKAAVIVDGGRVEILEWTPYSVTARVNGDHGYYTVTADENESNCEPSDLPGNINAIRHGAPGHAHCSHAKAVALYLKQNRPCEVCNGEGVSGGGSTPECGSCDGEGWVSRG